MGQNMLPNENNTGIKLDGEGEPISPSCYKKHLSRKTVAAILVFVILIIAGAAYFLFFNKEDNSRLPKEDTEVVKEEKVEELVIDKNLDTDQDKLPDYMEKVLNTNPNNPDTDSDGYRDFEEIKNGYNPIAVGAEGKYAQEEWELAKERIRIEDEEFYEKNFRNE